MVAADTRLLRVVSNFGNAFVNSNLHYACAKAARELTTSEMMFARVRMFNGTTNTIALQHSYHRIAAGVSYAVTAPRRSLAASLASRRSSLALLASSRCCSLASLKAIYRRIAPMTASAPSASIRAINMPR
jgi:hypothetical protein